MMFTMFKLGSHQKKWSQNAILQLIKNEALQVLQWECEYEDPWKWPKNSKIIITRL